jgi:hypothetical protein
MKLHHLYIIWVLWLHYLCLLHLFHLIRARGLTPPLHHVTNANLSAKSERKPEFCDKNNWKTRAKKTSLQENAMKRIRHHRDHEFTIIFTVPWWWTYVDHVITIIKIQCTKYSRNFKSYQYENFIVKMTIGNSGATWCCICMALHVAEIAYMLGLFQLCLSHKIYNCGIFSFWIFYTYYIY